MNPNNPFGMEIDDDGLPKYSPDRKNIAACLLYTSLPICGGERILLM